MFWVRSSLILGCLWARTLVELGRVGFTRVILSFMRFGGFGVWEGRLGIFISFRGIRILFFIVFFSFWMLKVSIRIFLDFVYLGRG